MSTTTLSRRRALGLALSAGAATAGIARPSRAQGAPLVVRLGFAQIGIGNRPFAHSSSAAVAHAEGYLEAEFRDDPGVRIEWSFFKGAGPAVNEAIANGQLDLAMQGDLPAVVGRANGLRTKLLMASGAHSPTYLGVPPGSDIRGVKDLAGRKVAIFRGTNLELAISKVLAANGLAERDLKIINMDFATMYAALATRQVDAAWGDPGLLDLPGKGLAEVVYSTKGKDPAFQRHSHVLVTEDFAARQPEVVGRIVKAIVRATRWASLEENREALFQVWSRTGVPPERFRADFEGDRLVDRGSPLFDDFMTGQYAEQARQAKAHGLIRREVDTAGWIDTGPLDRALEELGLQGFWPRLDAAGKPVAA